MVPKESHPSRRNASSNLQKFSSSRKTVANTHHSTAFATLSQADNAELIFALARDQSASVKHSNEELKISKRNRILLMARRRRSELSYTKNSHHVSRRFVVNRKHETVTRTHIFTIQRENGSFLKTTR